MNIKFFKGRLGEESFLTELESDVVPRKGDVVSLEDKNGDIECWDVIHTLISYERGFLKDGENHEVNVFLKKYVWPDEEF